MRTGCWATADTSIGAAGCDDGDVSETPDPPDAALDGGQDASLPDAGGHEDASPGEPDSGTERLLGVNDVSVFNRTLPWDHAAGTLFLNEAGGRAARLDGTPYRVDEWERRGMIGAATPRLWDELAERLARL